MTKRAGKNKKRALVRDQAALARGERPIDRPQDREQERLDVETALDLEIRAVRDGWGIEDPAFAQVRRALINKVATAGIQAQEPDVSIRALGAISRAEQRQQQIRISALGLKIRSRRREELPAQVGIVNNVTVEAPVAERRSIPRHQLIREIIQDREVRQAISGVGSPADGPRPTDAAQSRDVLEPEIPASPAP